MTALPEPISHTVLAVYAALEKSAHYGDSLGVPMSMVVEECERKLWMAFRWANYPRQEDEPGRKESIFATGRLWEERLLDDLEAINCEVTRLDPATGQQFKVALADGWLRGKLDGKVLGLPEAAKTLHVVETKSHNSKSFKELVKHAPPGSLFNRVANEDPALKRLYDSILKVLSQFKDAKKAVVDFVSAINNDDESIGGSRKGICIAKPDHYIQCQLYMHAEGLTRCLYYAVNKDTDERYAERVEYDHALAVRMEMKVERIVRADQAPPRLFEDPTAKAAFPCGWCAARPQCHEGAWARKNCRTCLSSEFLPGAVVRCALKGVELDYKAQQAGCSSHLFLPSLVWGEQVDASEAERWVKYRLKDGSEWVDGEGK